MNVNKPKRFLRRARAQKHLSLEQLAQKSGIQYNDLVAYEKNKQPLSDEDFTILNPILHLEQFYKHTISKSFIPVYFWEFIHLKPYSRLPFKHFFAWCKDGMKSVWQTIRHDSAFKQIMILLLITGILSIFAEQYTTIILVRSAFVPIGLTLLIYSRTKEITYTAMQAVKLFIYGGLMAIILVYFMRELFGFQDGLYGDITTGFIEEFGKLLIVIYALRRFKIQTVQGGMLIGFLIGAGFDVFETADYAMYTFLDTLDYDEMIAVIDTRSIFALLGIGHHFWTAMIAGALVYVKKQDMPNHKNMFNIAFLQVFIVVVIIHALWNYLSMINILLSVLLALFSSILFLLFMRHAQYEAIGNHHSIEMRKQRIDD